MVSISPPTAIPGKIMLSEREVEIRSKIRRIVIER